MQRTAKVFQVRHKYVANDLNILNMASMCGGRLKYLRNGYSMLEMTKELTYGLCMWEMTCICGKWLKYFRNG